MRDIAPQHMASAKWALCDKLHDMRCVSKAAQPRETARCMVCIVLAARTMSLAWVKRRQRSPKRSLNSRAASASPHRGCPNVAMPPTRAASGEPLHTRLSARATFSQHSLEALA